MGTQVRLEVPGTGGAGGWLTRPEGVPAGGLVVIQEIFGANAHMRAVTEGYARDGFLALAPALFDPVQPDAELDYDEAGFARGRTLAGELGFERALAIVDAAAAKLRARPDAELHVYDAGHGFNRDVDPRHHDPASASLAHGRTLDFLRRAFAPAAGH